jgi:glyoxylase-like metal-dependent hydrolase (beta-lactamase superfamily II)
VKGPDLVQSGLEVWAFRTPTLPPATHTNLSVLGDAEVVLVDPATPYDDERAAFDAQVESLLNAGRRVAGLVLTHHHHDHIGDAERLRAQRGFPIWAHSKTADLVGVPVDRTLGDGDRLPFDGGQKWRVVHTPGHAEGHICLFHGESRALVAGDMIAAEGTILIDPDDGHMGTYLRELERLVGMDPLAVIPAHGPWIPDGRSRLAETLAHRRMRQAQVLAALPGPGEAGKTDLDLVPGIYRNAIPEAAYPLAARSVRSALILLVEEGRAREDDGRFWKVDGL